MEEYVVIKKSDIEKRICSLKSEQKVSENSGDTIRAGIEYWQQEELKKLLTLSKPLQSIIEDAFDAGWNRGTDEADPQGTIVSEMKSEYLDNLKIE